MADSAVPSAELPPEAWAVALASLPAMGPSRLLALLGRWAPHDAWHQVQAGTATACPEVARVLDRTDKAVVQEWKDGARTTDVAAQWARHQGLDLSITWCGSSAMPAALRDDIEPPGVLFHRGSLEALDGPRVAIVGTRRCSRYGRDVAWDLGLDLSAAGVRVVSGLASGIDAAAHRGALAGPSPPVGVVGTGLDVVYPRSSSDLWRDVAAQGVLLSEVPLGMGPTRWRFPARNRLIAALADVVVVVESASRGGSLYTVDEAERRSTPVLAVPGPVRSPASAGTNNLLADGAAPCRDAADVLAVLGLSAEASGRGSDRRPAPDAAGTQVLDALGWEAADTTALVLRTGMELGALSVALDRLEAAGWLKRSGGWVEQVR
jgi:DNA processing protein